MTKQKLLFICQANAQRSPTFETWFIQNRLGQYDVRSAGTHWGYPYQIKADQIKDTLAWADRVFVMDLQQHRFIYERHNEYIDKVEVIGISDEYERDSPRLLNIITYWVDNFLEVQ